MTTDGPSLAQLIDPRTREGELWEPLPEGRLRCYACGHRCVILPRQRGICKVRYNVEGRLLVPWGYVAGLQLDPIEKKPFFHAYPGARALSFGMLGCDLHCSYCCRPETIIATTRGLIPVKQLFDSAEAPAGIADESVRVSPGLEVYSHTGRARPVCGLFRHRYSGPLVKLQPAYLLPLKLTPDHEVLTLSEADLMESCSPRFVPAGRLRRGDYLAIPRQLDIRYPAAYDVTEILRPLARQIRYPHRVNGPKVLRAILTMSEAGLTSREIGARIGKSASHVRHLRRRLRRGIWNLTSLDSKLAQVLVEGSRVRLSKEHAPGMPARLFLDEDLAALFGYYAAEGCVLHATSRVHSAQLIFSLGPHEADLAERISKLFLRVFGIQPYFSKRKTTLCVVVGKASVALFFESLCGTGARRKCVPAQLFSAPPSVADAFLKAYAEGDGHRRPSGLISATTVSRQLALGVAWLAMRTGRLPSIRAKRQAVEGKVLGRTVRRAPYVFEMTWADASKRLWLREDERYFYVPIRSVRMQRYNGWVYNLEVEEDRSYLAQLVATHNCQNALTSQALRDPTMGVPPQDVTPAEVVAAARRVGARVLTSTYNEPLITSEWAVEIFKAGKAQDLVCSYVSNGNATAEVLDYIRPYVDLYKVDLKSFDDRHYRQLGGVLKTILEGIRMIHARGFWLEIVTLTIPGFNDSDAELRDIAQFLVSLSPDIPWHVTAFHQDYKMRDRDNTSAKALIRAAEIGVAAGLRYVYAGNLPGRVGPFEHTCCPWCRALLIERVGYTILKDRLTPTRGRCPSCMAIIPGVWG
ncbi:MAG: radical SAM protein [Candidatus Rokuibacteriota bacterium]